MLSQFVGGPLHDLWFSPDQVRAVASFFPIPTRDGVRVFTMMPGPEDCERVLRGEIDKASISGERHAYEGFKLQNGSLQYREAAAALDRAGAQGISPDSSTAG